jgi:hypothetical protein
MLRCLLPSMLAFACCSQLAGDAIPTFTATSADASWSPTESYSITGSSFDFNNGPEMILPNFPFPLYSGEPFSQEFFIGPSTPLSDPGGLLTIAPGMTCAVEYTGGGIVMSPDFLVPSVDTTLTFPATLTGVFTAFPVGLNFPGCALSSFAPLATISIDLPGVLTIPFGNASNGFIDLGTVTFASISTAEPSGLLLLLVAAGMIGAARLVSTLHSGAA